MPPPAGSAGGGSADGLRAAGCLMPQVGFCLTAGPLPDRREGNGSGRGQKQLLQHAEQLPGPSKGRGGGGPGTRVGLGGLEPPASSLSGMRSNRLSYRPVNLGKLTWGG